MKKEIEKILKEQNQEQILTYPIKDEKEFEEKISNIDFNEINKLYENAIKKEKIKESKIEPIACIEKKKLKKEEKEKYEKIGKEIIKKGKYAVVTMAGGMRNKIRA